MYRDLLYLKSKKPNNSVKKWASDERNRHFSKTAVQTAYRCTIKCSWSVIVRETQIVITSHQLGWLLVKKKKR